MRSHTIRLQKIIAANATPFTVKVGTMAADSYISFRFNAEAYLVSTGDHKTWVGSDAWRKVGVAAPVRTGILVAPAVQATAGAALWTLAAGVSGNDVVLTVTLATNVRLLILLDPNYSVG
jgi:hypothetical protein